MSDASQAAAKTAAPAKGGRSLRTLILIALVLVLLIAGGGGAYLYFWRRPADHGKPAAKMHAPLPFYLKLKPFVVSLNNGSGTPHFVQLGVTLSLSGPALSPLIKAVLPEVEDAMRQSLLAFKVEELTTPAGVDKLRQAMIGKVNHVLRQRLGAARIEEASGGKMDAVRKIYFTTLIIE